MKKLNKIVPDTSAIINEIISSGLQNKEFCFKELIIHRALLAELENQANKKRDIGFIGLDEINKLNKLSKTKKFEISFFGDTPNIDHIRLAKAGAIDAMIRALAEDLDATLITSDLVQAEVGKAIGINVIHIPSSVKEKELIFIKYFKPDFMSVHLKEGEYPRAKKGIPGNWKFVEISKNKLGADEIEEMTEQIVEAGRTLNDSFLEIERRGSIIAQINNYRIVIVRPPLSDAGEITIVRPVKKLSVDDYKLSSKLKRRFRSRAEGVLIAGAPGEGKSTFATALAKDYESQEKVVKSLESPRDLQLPNSVTQLNISRASHKEIKDILLLTRPDYTIFDEMRDTPDFKLFSDMRLSGVGMIGVIHATKPIDAVQRFIDKVELGMIPSIIDTVIFIRAGKVQKVYNLKMNVKVPTGMKDQDLARPVVDIFDFETNKLEYEIYTFGDAKIVIPIEAGTANVKSQRKDLKWRLRESKKDFYFHFLTPSKKANLVIEGHKIATIPLARGRDISINKKSQIGRAILEALLSRSEIKFES